jgi:ABC-type sugar transport system permease subunit
MPEVDAALIARHAADRKVKRRRALFAGLSFISPNLALVLVFTLGPTLFTLGLAFFRWDPFTQPTFVGFENFNRMFADSRFWYYLLNTGVFMLGLPLTMAGALFLAVVLSQKLRGVIAYRTVFYLPTLTSGVALFLLWKVMYNKEGGLINTLILPLLQLFGVDGPSGAPIAMSDLPDWLNQSWRIFGLECYLAKPALIFMGVWAGIGGGTMILYLAALAGVPPELYEAAEIDGARRWRRFWDITWPMIAPTTFFIVVMGMIGGLQGGFEMAYLMTSGGPDESTTTIGYFIFTKGFGEFEFGYAAAVSFVLFALVATITAVNWRFGSKAGDY